MDVTAGSPLCPACAVAAVVVVWLLLLQVGFNGKEAWVACRAHNAVTSQLNPVDLTRRSPSYEMRLAKYAKRGFEVRERGICDCSGDVYACPPPLSRFGLACVISRLDVL